LLDVTHRAPPRDVRLTLDRVARTTPRDDEDGGSGNG